MNDLKEKFVNMMTEEMKKYELVYRPDTMEDLHKELGNLLLKNLKKYTCDKENYRKLLP